MRCKDSPIQAIGTAPGEIAAVLFDLDGTLLDHRGAATAAVESIASQHTAETAELVRVWCELENRHLDDYLTGKCSFAEQRRRRLRAFLPLLGVPVGDDGALDAWFTTHCLPEYENAWRAYPDVLPCLERLAALPTKPKLAVLTNGDTAQQRSKLARLGLSGHFDAVLTSADVGVAKPDPRAFTLACETIGTSCGAAVYVGDRLDVDAIPAQQAGLTGVWLDRGVEPTTAQPVMRQDRRGVGVLRIESLTDLADTLDNHQAAVVDVNDSKP